MNSLRTDDIIGAVPRIRHMPKNLYRPQGLSYNGSIDGFNQQHSGVRNVSKMMDYDASYNGGKWEQSYNQNMYGNYPLSQYDPNPFIKRNIKHPILKTQRSQYNNRGNGYNNGRSVSEFNKQYQDSAQKQLQSNINKERYMVRDRDSGEKRRMSLDYEDLNKRVGRGQSRGRYDNSYGNNQSNSYGNNQREQSQTKYTNSNNNNNRILPKQALMINYQQLKAMNLPQISNNNNNSKNDNINKNSDQLRKQQNPQRMKSSSYNNNNLNKSINNNNSNINNPLQKNINSENGRRQRQRQKQRSIFRGIGFNIITNSKYQYNLQTSTPYYTSRVKQ